MDINSGLTKAQRLEKYFGTRTEVTKDVYFEEGDTLKPVLAEGVADNFDFASAQTYGYKDTVEGTFANMEILRLKKENYDALLKLLNYVFTQKNGKEMDFEKELPKMCVRDDEHMGRHFGIFEDEKLVAALGVYSLPVKIVGEDLLFSTVGNIATHPDYQGKGYMNALIERAMQELEDMDADASRLGGLRQRYNRFGYENCGRVYQFSLTSYNTSRKFPNGVKGAEFERINREDIAGLKIAKALQSASQIAVERKEANNYEEVYASMTAWKNIPYLARKNGRPIGYLCVSENGRAVAENYAYGVEEMTEMLCAWQQQVAETISFRFQPYQVNYIRVFSALCEGMSISAPCHFKFIHWEKVVSAFMKLKSSYMSLPYGEFKIEITNYGVLRLYVGENGVGCEKTNDKADICLNQLEAARYLFGVLPPECTAPTSEIVNAWLPLPLSWNLQDRV